MLYKCKSLITFWYTHKHERKFHEKRDESPEQMTHPLLYWITHIIKKVYVYVSPLLHGDSVIHIVGWRSPPVLLFFNIYIYTILLSGYLQIFHLKVNIYLFYVQALKSNVLNNRIKHTFRLYKVRWSIHKSREGYICDTSELFFTFLHLHVLSKNKKANISRIN